MAALERANLSLDLPHLADRSRLQRDCSLIQIVRRLRIRVNWIATDRHGPEAGIGPTFIATCQSGQCGHSIHRSMLCFHRNGSRGKHTAQHPRGLLVHLEPLGQQIGCRLIVGLAN